MGNRSKQTGSWSWRKGVNKRSKRDHANKKAARKQRQRLEGMKSAAELRRIALGARHLIP